MAVIMNHYGWNRKYDISSTNTLLENNSQNRIFKEWNNFYTCVYINYVHKLWLY